MPLLRRVLTYPPTGPVGAPWHPYPDRDSLLRTATGVLALYSGALPALGLPSPAPEIRVFVHDRGVPWTPSGASAIVCLDHAEGFQMAFCLPPDGLSQAPPLARRRLVLDLAHGLVRFLAPVRGWDPVPLDALHERLAATDLVLRWETPWRSAPGRRHRARGVFAMDPDGFGRMVLEVVDREGALVARSPAQVAFCSLPGWRRAAETLRWDGPGLVEIFPFVDQLGRTLGPTALAPDAGIAPEAAPEPAPVPGAGMAAAPGWDVVVRRDPEEEHVGPRIRIIGGGPMNGVPQAYDRALHDRLQQLTRPEWVQWWANAGVDDLELSYYFEPSRSTPDVRRVREGVRATVRRSAHDMREALEPDRLAHADSDALVALLRRRFDLPEPPPWRPAVWDPAPASSAGTET